MIPKIIHYCWFGDKDKPAKVKKCIKSWKKYCPGYEIKEWNEDNFDINICDYVKEAYDSKKYAFVSDYARFYILYHEGGVYFDTDVEIIRPIDDIVEKGAFMGCESDACDLSQGFTAPTNVDAVNPGLGIAAAPGLRLYKEMLDFYGEQHFIMPNGSLNTTTVVEYTTNILLKNGMKNVPGIQKVAEILIYPKEYFCPLNNNTGKLEITDNTYTIHWYSKTWVSKNIRIKSKITRIFHRVFGEDCFQWLKRDVRK